MQHEKLSYILVDLKKYITLFSFCFLFPTKAFAVLAGQSVPSELFIFIDKNLAQLSAKGKFITKLKKKEEREKGKTRE